MVLIRGASAIAALLLVVLSQTPIRGCEIRVRDSAFRTARDTHRLCLIADSTDEYAGEAFSRLVEQAEQWGDQINLEVERIDADSPETDWRSLGLPSAPPQLPVTVLVGRDNGNAEYFVIDHWEPAPDNSELSHIFQSPLRQRLASDLARNLAVLIYCPQNASTDSPRNSELESIVQSGIKEERIGLALITLDRDDPAERLLTQFMGIRYGSPDTVCVAFGRGKLMTPPLKGDEITASNIKSLVLQIRQECSCSKPIQTMGVDLPLVWTNQIDSGVVLMDEELDLSDLDEQLESLLSSNRGAEESAEQKPLAIPPGRLSVPDQESPRSRSDGATAPRFPAAMVYFLGILLGAVVVLAFRRVRLPRVASQHLKE